MYWMLLIFWAFGFMVMWEIPLLRLTGPARISGKSVSIIIPARNEEQNLGRLLASLASQTYRQKEVIVMDDHSTDKTAAIALSYGVQVMYSSALPKGWFGKPWVCWQGSWM